DSDVYPVVLGHGGGSFVKEEADFFGAHLEHLRAGAEVTTAEYSGYNILPPASFDGMADLAAGVQKEDKVAFWQKSPEHKTLTLQPRERVVKPCAKILGGNAAVKLGAFSKLPPFFSSHYDLNGETFLARGEDTLLGLGIERSGLTCTDIALHILHDTYKDFPKEPDLKCDKSVQERFYYACTGWVGRNPFMNHLLGSDLKATREYQRERLAPGLASLAKYTSNPKFNTVLGNFDKSWDNVGRYVNEYEQTLEAWGEFTERIGLIS
ncbi:MAG: hypothetical protein FWB75_09540, partial [Oscillospiraceae bacterium]|nr:hypothetical protein [Oscillospiraceae bacterium]